MRFFSLVQRVFILFLFMALPVNAGVYKWTDEQGNVHYGDKPVNQKQATELQINSNVNTGVTHSAGDNKERDRMLQELQDDRGAREKIKAEQRVERKKRKKACVQLKKRLLQHQRASSVYKRDAKGERVYYTSEERDEKVKNINKGIAKNCR